MGWKKGEKRSERKAALQINSLKIVNRSLDGVLVVEHVVNNFIEHFRHDEI